MKQYIDKSAIVAEIESLRRTTFTNFDEGVNATVQTLLEIVDTLEVKEVDLEKEKDDYWNKLCDSEFGELLERDAKWFDDIAKHFFELGVKTKGEYIMTNKVLEAMIEDISSELNACMAVVKYENTELSEKWQDAVREIYSIICKAKKI